MSAPTAEYVPRAAQPEPPTESRSSVKITLNAKRDLQWEVKVYVGDSDIAVEYARKLAVLTHEKLLAEFGVVA